MLKPRGPVPQDSHVRDQGDQHKQHTGGKVGEYGAGVPHQWGADVGPDSPGIVVGDEGQGVHPVHQAPGPAGVNQGHHNRGHQREYGQHLCRSGGRAPPLGLGKPQNGRQHHSSMADADPEHEVDDEESPHNRPVQAGHPQPLVNHQPGGAHSNHDDDGQNSHRYPIPARRG